MADFHVFKDDAAVGQAAAGLFTALSHRALDERGRFTVALSGGSTPIPLFKYLASDAFRPAIPWDRTLIFWGDDRAVPPDHEHSNFRLAHETLLAHVPIPKENIVRIQGELGAKQGAEILRRDLVEAFGPNTLPRFDLVLQGLGTDGHTASLFPGNDALDCTDFVAAVINPPAQPALDRVTLTLPVLNNARTALFLVTGPSKQSLISEIVNDPTAPERFPAARVEATETLWYLDEAAFALVQRD